MPRTLLEHTQQDLQEKPKEKTIFNVKLESFDAASKPKIIREVKALVPNLTLIDVCCLSFRISPQTQRFLTGQEVRRIATKGLEGELAQGGRGEVEEDVRGPRRRCQT